MKKRPLLVSGIYIYIFIRDEILPNYVMLCGDS